MEKMTFTSFGRCAKRGLTRRYIPNAKYNNITAQEKYFVNFFMSTGYLPVWLQILIFPLVPECRRDHFAIGPEKSFLIEYHDGIEQDIGYPDKKGSGRTPILRFFRINPDIIPVKFKKAFQELSPGFGASAFDYRAPCSFDFGNVMFAF